MSRSLSLLLLLLATASSGASGPLAVESVHPRLFYNHSGTVSPLITREFALWNTIIGEGAAEEPSNATLVDVIVTGDRGSYTPEARVDLTVTHSRTGKLIAKQSVEVGILSESGKFHAAFWLANTGCEPLTISAKLQGSRQSLEAQVPFACGE